MTNDLATRAKKLTRQYFGRAISLYAPLYISNYCDNHCLYCGFSRRHDISRKKLSAQEIEKECQTLAKTGLQNILILTGESRLQSPVSYIKEAVLVAGKYFPNISLEIYPLETKEYCELFLAGADGVTIYQETYDREVYKQLHPAGKKRDYDYRYQAPEKIAQAGMRHLSLGILLGLADWREDLKALFEHLRYLEKKYPGVEYSLSFPRLQKVAGDTNDYQPISDQVMLSIIATTRLMFPRVGINLSTRESAQFRDQILEFGVTKLSAGSSTRVGGYNDNEGTGQFTINDERSLVEVKEMLTKKGYDPVITDWRQIGNE
ncbi:MAG: thiamine biosynthesis ThiH [Candidatus Saganbacteria bacterium]|uniref:Thiamine biosynthesis ThiH n=1 Tax=Candidatus Saganbacteria bacterium TaxID=2575572 RepID=A0A833L1Q8_UNCSA|nr:MAG: thiamine biosynthesis ThiH [Candidatus Saganbacteria bacterium]